MIMLSWLGVYKLKKHGQLPPWLMRVFVFMSFSGWVATLAGWYVTEIGRQPYLVQGVLKVEEAATQIASANVGFSLALYLSIYSILLIAYLRTVFLMARRAIDIEEYQEDNNENPSLINNPESAYV